MTRRALLTLTAAITVSGLVQIIGPVVPAAAGSSTTGEIRISARGPLVRTATGIEETTPVSTVTFPEQALPTPSPPDMPASGPGSAPAEPTTPATTEPTAPAQPPAPAEPLSGAPSPQEPYRAFSADSPWNRLLPTDAPVHPDSARVLANIKANNVNSGCVMLSGTGTNEWGTPVYWADSQDPTYQILRSRYYLPPEFASLRIPRGAKPMVADDFEMTVYDVERNYVAWLYEAVYDAANDRWSASGGSIAYLDSNGVLGSLPGSDEPRNTGSQRGLNGAVVAARYDEVQAGVIEHALRIGVRNASTGHLWPMSGSDGRSVDPYAPKQGSRMRIKPGVDLSRFGLTPEALVLATTLQRYGALVGDSTGAPVELKLEDTAQQGRGQLWSVPQNALCAVPIEAFEVLAEDYR